MPLQCVDGLACTIDGCGPNGCTHDPAPDGQICSDGNACSAGDVCLAGACIAGTPLPVDDSNPCTLDTCDPSLGVLHTPVPTGTLCDDANACNGISTCTAAGQCVPGTPPVIDDLNPCTNDSCDPILGVVHTPRPDGDEICGNGNEPNSCE